MKLTIISDHEVALTRPFTAPRRAIFDAMTKPARIRQWYGPPPFVLATCEVDLRVGGAWRNVLHAPDGNEHAFSGIYREITPPARLVLTENYEALGPGHELVVTISYVEHGAETTLTLAFGYSSRAQRDAHLASPMEALMRESFDRLATLLPALS